MPATPALVANAEARVSASRDNTLYQSNTGDLSNGAGESLFVGRTNAGQSRRTVVAFDLSAAVPKGARVVSVTLTLHMSKSQAGGMGIAAHRLTASWGEAASKAAGEQGGGGNAEKGDATWIHRSFDTEKWAKAGGDFVESASATTVVSQIGPYAWQSTPQLAADVQGWIDDPASNFGWVLIGDESNTQTTKRFDSRETADGTKRPTLTVAYVTP